MTSLSGWGLVDDVVVDVMVLGGIGNTLIKVLCERHRYRIPLQGAWLSWKSAGLIRLCDSVTNRNILRSWVRASQFPYPFAADLIRMERTQYFAIQGGCLHQEFKPRPYFTCVMTLSPSPSLYVTIIFPHDSTSHYLNLINVPDTQPIPRRDVM